MGVVHWLGFANMIVCELSSSSTLGGCESSRIHPQVEGRIVNVSNG